MAAGRIHCGFVKPGMSITFGPADIKTKVLRTFEIYGCLDCFAYSYVLFLVVFIIIPYIRMCDQWGHS